MAANDIITAAGVPSPMVVPAMSPCAGASLFGSDAGVVYAFTGTPDVISRLMMAGQRREVVLIRGIDTGATCAGRPIVRVTQVGLTGFMPGPQTPEGVATLLASFAPTPVVAPPGSPCAGALLWDTQRGSFAITGTPDIINRLIAAGQTRQPVVMHGMFTGTMCEGRRLFRALIVI